MDMSTSKSKPFNKFKRDGEFNEDEEDEEDEEDIFEFKFKFKSEKVTGRNDSFS